MIVLGYQALIGFEGFTELWVKASGFIRSQSYPDSFIIYSLAFSFTPQSPHHLLTFYSTNWFSSPHLFWTSSSHLSLSPHTYSAWNYASLSYLQYPHTIGIHFFLFPTSGNTPSSALFSLSKASGNLSFLFMITDWVGWYFKCSCFHHSLKESMVGIWIISSCPGLCRSCSLHCHTWWFGFQTSFWGFLYVHFQN